MHTLKQNIAQLIQSGMIDKEPGSDVIEMLDVKM
jgi:hypothetical protein